MDMNDKKMIPKKLHFIWLGPYKNNFIYNIDSYKYYNPEWDIKLWDDVKLKYIWKRIINKAAIKMIPIYATKADLLRLELINLYGGVYVDIDSKCLKPIESIKYFEKHSMFCSNTKGGQADIGFFGAVKNHPGIDETLRKFKVYFNRIKKENKYISVYFVARYWRRIVANKYTIYKIDGNRKEGQRIISCNQSELNKNTIVLQNYANTYKKQCIRKNKFRLEI